MDTLTIYEKARGQFLKIILAVLVIGGAGWAYMHVPKSLSHRVLRKTVVVKMTYLPYLIEGVAGLSALYILYIILLTKTTKIEAGRINLSYTQGLFDRRKDAIDMTGVHDFVQEQTIFDMFLGVCSFMVYSRDTTDPHLHLRGISKSDAARLYEHLQVFSNRSIVKYVQSQPDRNAYREKYRDDQEGAPGQGEEEQKADKPSDRYVRPKIRNGEGEDDGSGKK